MSENRVVIKDIRIIITNIDNLEFVAWQDITCGEYEENGQEDRIVNCREGAVLGVSSKMYEVVRRDFYEMVETPYVVLFVREVKFPMPTVIIGCKA